MVYASSSETWREKLLHEGTGLGIEGPEGLVQEQDSRIIGQSLAIATLLLHPSGKALRISLFKTPQAPPYR